MTSCPPICLLLPLPSFFALQRHYLSSSARCGTPSAPESSGCLTRCSPSAPPPPPPPPPPRRRRLDGRRQERPPPSSSQLRRLTDSRCRTGTRTAPATVVSVSDGVCCRDAVTVVLDRWRWWWGWWGDVDGWRGGGRWVVGEGVLARLVARWWCRQ